MLELNHKSLLTPHQLRRLAAVADVDTKDLIELTGLSESAINNYLSDECTRQNYLFQFALEFLAHQKLHHVSNEIYYTPSPYTFKRLEHENRLMFSLLERLEDVPCDTESKTALHALLALIGKRYPKPNRN